MYYIMECVVDSTGQIIVPGGRPKAFHGKYFDKEMDAENYANDLRECLSPHERLIVQKNSD